ncbi:hypothetical protein GS489_07605 [Rhodococcus hoagii]|nr:hypothetical protein [Prescottella equi]MBM4616227.1 hypothetical protein [Prescottella equi]MBM4617969.1 hypothetical protein [Prescottella equi]MBM4617982.1 hypothetical protein [Prescottella equi]MBM4617988.1 hypothetical protein [Prescottella equi]
MSAPTPAPDTPQGQMTPAQLTAQQIAAQAQQRQQISSLADALIPQTQPGAILSKGKVMSWESGLPPTVTIQLGGDTSSSIPFVRYLDSYTPTPGDTVLIAKQGSEIIVIGKAHEFYLGQPEKNGWLPPSLTTTWNRTVAGAAPPLFRKVFDHGEQRIQMQGRVWRNGSNTSATLFTLPVGYRPTVQRLMLAARENLGGLNEVQVVIEPSGAVNIDGHLLPGPMNQGVTTSYYNVNHFHVGPYGTVGGTSNDGTSDVRSSTGVTQFGVLGGSAQDGGRDPNHRHTTNPHNHVAGFPGWVSLDGVEFFL